MQRLLLFRHRSKSHFVRGAVDSHLMFLVIVDIPVGGKSPCRLNVSLSGAHMLENTNIFGTNYVGKDGTLYFPTTPILSKDI